MLLQPQLFLRLKGEETLKYHCVCWPLCEKFSIVSTQRVWDVSERSQSDLHCERHLRDLSETSQKRRLSWDVFKTSQIHLKKDVFCTSSLRRLKNIFRKKCLFRDISETSQKHLSQVSVISQKYPTKWFCVIPVG